MLISVNPGRIEAPIGAEPGRVVGPGGPSTMGVPIGALPAPAAGAAFKTRQRAAMSPDDWGLSLTVVVDGEPVGVQGLQAAGFRVRRTIGSGSFLVSDASTHRHRHGARAMMLSLAFDRLGALAAESGYMDGNDASRIVSERLGYSPNGVVFHDFEGVRCRENRVLLEADRWRSIRAAWLDGVNIKGVAALRRQLEITEPVTVGRSPNGGRLLSVPDGASRPARQALVLLVGSSTSWSWYER